MSKRIKIILLAILTLILNLAADQVTKEYARQQVQGKGTIRVVGNVLVFRYAENDGAFLSMGSGLEQPWKMILLLLFPVILVIASTLYMFLNKKLTHGQIIAIACVIGGGVSNIIDRIFNKGFVTDFINFGIGNLRTGILNIADMSITFGAIVFMVLEGRREKAEKLEAARNSDV